MPPKNSKAAIGFYLSGVGLQSVLDDLTRVGFRSEDVCAILPQTHSVARTLEDGLGESEAAQWFAQFGAVVIPGVGVFVAGQEFAAILRGSANGGMAGDHALYDLGLPPGQIEGYREWLGGGGVIVYVSCKAEDQIYHAIEVLEEAGAEEVFRLDSLRPLRKPSVVPLLKAS